MQFEVATVIKFRPLQFTIGGDEVITGVIGSFDRDVVAVGTRARYRGTGKLHANTALPGVGIIGMFIEPDQIADPIGMGISRDNNVVPNIVIVKSLECSVSVRLIAVPSIIIERIDISIRNRFIETRKH